MAVTPNELLHGTLDTLILKTLAAGPRHGYAIARWLEEGTGDLLQIEDGSLYPALYRMERGLDRGGMGHLGARPQGEVLPDHRRERKRLATSTAEWASFAAAISKVLLTV